MAQEGNRGGPRHTPASTGGGSRRLSGPDAVAAGGFQTFFAASGAQDIVAFVGQPGLCHGLRILVPRVTLAEEMQQMRGLLQQVAGDVGAQRLPPWGP